MRTWSFSEGLIATACSLLCNCALDDRTPTEAVAPNQAVGASSAGASGSGSGAPSSMAAAGSEGGGSGSAAGSGGASGSGGIGMGMRPGSGGAPAGGSGAAGSGGASSAGSTGMQTPVESIAVPVGGSAPTIISSCPAFSPCGGELEGTWAYTEVCPAAPQNELQMMACPDLTVEFATGGAAGLAFAGGQVARSGAPVGDSTIHFPESCLGFLGCEDIPLLTQTPGECSLAGAVCDCVTASSIDWGQQAFMISGTQLRLADGRTFDYCVETDRLMYRETGDAKEPGVFTLQRN